MILFESFVLWKTSEFIAGFLFLKIFRSKISIKFISTKVDVAIYFKCFKVFKSIGENLG